MLHNISEGFKWAPGISQMMRGVNALAPHHVTHSRFSLMRSCTSVAAYATSLPLARAPAWTMTICAKRLQDADRACILHLSSHVHMLWQISLNYLASAFVGAALYVRKLQMACMIFSSGDTAVWELQVSNSLWMLLQHL